MNIPVKILLAEDEPALGQIIKESLENPGNLMCYYATTGKKAFSSVSV